MAIKVLPTEKKILSIAYNEYQMKRKEKIFYTLLAGCVLFFIGFTFYQNHLLSLLFACLGVLYPKIKKQSIIHKRKKQLNLQFKQALYSLSSALSAGKSVENSFHEAIQDLRFLYPDPKTHMIQELEMISRRIENGENIEQALLNLAERADLDDIKNFADTFTICKRTGGDLVDVIRRTSEIISEKLEIEQDIQVLVAQKKLESNILIGAPVMIVALLRLGSPEYMEPLYTEPIGLLIMTVALVLNLLAFFWVKQIMNIKV